MVDMIRANNTVLFTEEYLEELRKNAEDLKDDSIAHKLPDVMDNLVLVKKLLDSNTTVFEDYIKNIHDASLLKREELKGQKDYVGTAEENEIAEQKDREKLEQINKLLNDPDTGDELSFEKFYLKSVLNHEIISGFKENNKENVDVVKIQKEIDNEKAVHINNMARTNPSLKSDPLVHHAASASVFAENFKKAGSLGLTAAKICFAPQSFAIGFVAKKVMGAFMETDSGKELAAKASKKFNDVFNNGKSSKLKRNAILGLVGTGLVVGALIGVDTFEPELVADFVEKFKSGFTAPEIAPTEAFAQANDAITPVEVPAAETPTLAEDFVEKFKSGFTAAETAPAETFAEANDALTSTETQTVEEPAVETQKVEEPTLETQKVEEPAVETQDYSDMFKKGDVSDGLKQFAENAGNIELSGVDQEFKTADFDKEIFGDVKFDNSIDTSEFEEAIKEMNGNDNAFDGVDDEFKTQEVQMTVTEIKIESGMNLESIAGDLLPEDASYEDKQKMVIKIAELNGLEDANQIRAGETLTLPVDQDLSNVIMPTMDLNTMTLDNLNIPYGAEVVASDYSDKVAALVGEKYPNASPIQMEAFKSGLDKSMENAADVGGLVNTSKDTASSLVHNYFEDSTKSRQLVAEFTSQELTNSVNQELASSVNSDITPVEEKPEVKKPLNTAYRNHR